MTCGNPNETLKYPGRFHRDTERYFRKAGTIFEKIHFRKNWSIISCFYINIKSSQQLFRCQYICSEVVPLSVGLLTRLWIRMRGMLCYRNRRLYVCSHFFGQNMTFAFPKNLCVADNVHEINVISSPYDSIWRPSLLESIVMTTEQCCIFWHRSHFEFHQWTWDVYINKRLSIKTILFDILVFWCHSGDDQLRHKYVQAHRWVWARNSGESLWTHNAPPEPAVLKSEGEFNIWYLLLT